MCEAAKEKKKGIVEEKPTFFYNLYNEDGFENSNSACCV